MVEGNGEHVLSLRRLSLNIEAWPYPAAIAKAPLYSRMERGRVGVGSTGDELSHTLGPEIQMAKSR